MHPNDGRVVSNFIVQALQGQDITIYGEGQQTRSFCYQSDLIEGFLRLMATGPEVTGPVNLGNPGEFTIRQLAELVIELTGSASKLVFRPLPADDPFSASPTSLWPAPTSAGNPPCPCARAWSTPLRTLTSC